MAKVKMNNKQDNRDILNTTDPITSGVYDFFVKDKFLNFTDYDEETVSPETHLQELYLDSLDILELIMEAEMEYDLDIRDDEFQDITSVGGLVKLVSDKIREKK